MNEQQKQDRINAHIERCPLREEGQTLCSHLMPGHGYSIPALVRDYLVLDEGWDYGKALAFSQRINERLEEPDCHWLTTYTGRQFDLTVESKLRGGQRIIK